VSAFSAHSKITIEQQVDNRSFRGSLQVTSSRPVYNSDYKTSVLNINDRDFEFVFQENTMIQWSNDQHRDNLSSVLAFYANLILAMDYDTFAMEVRHGLLFELPNHHQQCTECSRARLEE